ncbi:putative E1-E2 ATPase [Ordospora pajunii]|uniref:putative E1-E2 ATPase n=1 Tax=Ordospora pajunii TaxID=3039483 RepID=UPI00295272C5|nr:putative E1-E2 ATPase [Ordospora pajunii]KAH9411049.1 putative E1-E2 ATPase [Ordospora pajunii]
MFVAIKQERPFVSVEGRKRRVPVLLYNVLCVVTFGMLYMICKYVRSAKKVILSSRCNISDADCVIVTHHNGQEEFIDVRLYETMGVYALQRYAQDGKARVIESRFYRLIYDVPAKRFVVPPEQKALERSFEEFYSGEVSKSPEKEMAEYVLRNVFYGKNITNLPVLGILEILVKNTLSVTFMSNVACVLVWNEIDYARYAMAMGMIVMYSFVFTNWEDIRHSISMQRLVKKQSVRTLRAGRFVQVDSREVYPGDVIYIEPCNEFLCDALVIRGDAITNECLLTGETVPIYKNADQESIIYSGTGVLKSINTMPMSSCMGGGNLCRVRNLTNKNKPRTVGVTGSIDAFENFAIGLVLRTGFHTARGQILKNMMNARPVVNRFVKEAELAIFGVLCAAIVLTAVMAFVFDTMGFSGRMNVAYSIDLFFTLANPALPIYLRLGTQLCYKKLLRRNIHCSSLDRINLAGRVDTVVFDKTGTLTCEGLDILCIDDLQKSTNEIEEMGMTARIGLSTCHLVYELDGKYSGDSLDLKMFIFSSSRLVQHENLRSVVVGGHSKIYGPILKEYNDTDGTVYYQKGRNGKHGISDEDMQDAYSTSLGVERTWECEASDEIGSREEGPCKKEIDEEINVTIVKSYEFDSVIRRMSVVVEYARKKCVFSKGSPESIRSVLKKVPNGYEEKVREYSLGGYRVISLAYKEVSESVDRSTDESELSFLALVVFSNKLKADSRRTIDELNEARIRNVMCTGDNILTAISVGRECGIIEEFMPVIFPVIEENADSIFDVEWLCVGDEEEFTFDKVRLSLYRENDRGSSTDFVVACEGREFDFFRNTHYFQFILERGAVFARFNPGQKKALVENLQAKGRVIMFCGDGANDSGALSSADVGLALAHNEASLAASFMSSDIGSVVDLIREGRSAFVTSVSTFKYVISSCVVAYMALVFLIIRKKFLSDLQTMHGDLFISVPIAYMLTRSEASKKIFATRPNVFLTTKWSTIPLCITVAIEGAVLLLLSVYEKPSAFLSVETISGELVFFGTVFIYVLNGMYLSNNKPHCQDPASNVMFKVFAVGMISVNFLLLVGVYKYPDVAMEWLPEYKFVRIGMSEFVMIVLCIVVIGIAVFVVQPFVSKILKCKRHSGDDNEGRD